MATSCAAESIGTANGVVVTSSETKPIVRLEL